MQDFVYTAPLIIICCGDPSVYTNAEAVDDANELRAIRDLGISSQNLVLRATELGLGTCYVGWMDKEKVKSVLGIPEHFVTPYAITVGYAAKAAKETSRLPVEDILL